MVNLKNVYITGMAIVMTLLSMNLSMFNVSASSSATEDFTCCQNISGAKDPARIAESDQRYRGHIVDYKAYVSNENSQ